MKDLSLLTLAAVALLAACGPATQTPDAGGPTPDTTCDAAPENVTLAQLQTEILEPKCATCHYPAMNGMPAGTGGAYGDYTSAAKSAEMINKISLFAGSKQTLRIVDQMAGTTAEKLANSTLWLKVSAPTSMTNGFRGPNNEPTGLRMPNDTTVLTDAEIKKFKDWICTGSQL